MVVCGYLDPTMFPNKVVFELLQPAVGTSISRPESPRCGEWYAGTAGPVIHIADIAGEDNLRFGLRRMHVLVLHGRRLNAEWRQGAELLTGRHKCRGRAEE